MGKEIVIICLTALVSVVEIFFKKEDEDKTNNSVPYKLVKFFRDILIIVASALIALMITNHDQNEKTKKQLEVFCRMGAEECLNYVSHVRNVMELYLDHGESAIMVVPDLQIPAEMDSLISEQHFDPNTTLSSENFIMFTEPELLKGVIRSSAERDSALNRLREHYAQDQEISPRVFLDLYRVAYHSLSAYCYYLDQADALNGISPDWANRLHDFLDIEGQEEKVPDSYKEIDEMVYRNFLGVDDYILKPNYLQFSLHTASDAQVRWEDVRKEMEEEQERIKKAEELAARAFRGSGKSAEADPQK